jgi:hypothetical protein
MVPSYFRAVQDCEPVYYSLQYPSTHAFSPKSRTMSSVLFEMKELVHVLRVFCEELTKESSMCYGSILGEIPANVDFNFYHNKADGKGGIFNTSELFCSDINFLTGKYDELSQGARISSDGKFLRGCVRISYKNK